MTDLITRYVSETIRHLPQKEKEDVGLELKANILDMLGETYTEEEVEQVLLAMGNPSKLAQQYSKTTRYLIGPTNFDLYVMVLKIVCIVVTIVTTTLKLVPLFFSSQSIGFMSLLGSVVVGIIGGLSSSFLWVTITFAILDYFQVKADTREWTIKDLECLDDIGGLEIKVKDILADLIGMTVFFILLLVFYSSPNLVAVYRKGLEPVPIFIAESVKPYILFWMASNLFGLGVCLAKLLKGRWNYLLLGLSVASDLVATLFFVFLITRFSVVNPEFTSFFRNGLASWVGIAKAASVVLIILTLLGIGDDLHTVLHRSKLQKLSA